MINEIFNRGGSTTSENSRQQPSNLPRKQSNRKKVDSYLNKPNKFQINKYY